MPATTFRDEARKLVDQLPDDATWDVLYQIYVRQSIDAGLDDARAGRTVPVDEVRRRLGDSLGFNGCYEWEAITFGCTRLTVPEFAPLSGQQIGKLSILGSVTFGRTQLVSARKLLRHEKKPPSN